ncbi:MAG: hypothetical protein FIA97_04640 [Methylococcaceae bacterium]|nr:hypothetical protein [Methylococcaceae bacterium]
MSSVRPCSRHDLEANDSLNWEDSGAASGFVLDSPLHLATRNGIQCTVTSPEDLLRQTQGIGNKPWRGNFSPGDELVYTNRWHRPLIITFAKPVRGVGVQIQDAAPGPFTGVLRLFGVAGCLATVTVEGQSDNHNDGSAVFIGAVGEVADIVKADFHTLAHDPGEAHDFAINRVLLRT